MIIAEDSDGAESVDIYKIYAVHGVSSYVLDATTFNTWNIVETGNPGPKFLCIDTYFHEAASHWIFESAVYLPLFKLLKNVDNTIQLHIKVPVKKYKKLFCDFFGIEPTYDLPPANTCFFPNPISAQNRLVLNESFIPQLDRFIAAFTDIKLTPASLDFLILPRGKAENYHGNDRTVDFSMIYAAAEAGSSPYSILNTDDISNLTDQIVAVRNAKNLILCDGAAFVINTLFAKNATIYIIGCKSLVQSSTYPLACLLLNMLSMRNNNICIYSDIPSVCSVLAPTPKC